METKKVKNVLIAIDYDPSAEKIVKTGYSIAKAMKANTILLHVIVNATYYSSLSYSPITGFLGFTDTDFRDLVDTEGLKSATKGFLDKTKEYLNDESIESIVKEGDAADEILKTARQVFADIIVMGSHSRGWLEEALVGSVTEEVLNKTEVPLFIVPIKKRK